MEKTLYYSKAKLIDYEDSVRYAHVLMQYFDYIRPHGYINNIETHTNTMILYNTPHWQPTEIADVVHINGVPSDIIFYDRKATMTFAAHYRWLEICVNGKHAGYYCKDINVLVATDWTHIWSERNEEIVREILEKIGAHKISERGKKRKIALTIGSDPEFELIEADKILYASKYFAGTDSDTEIGVDGAGDQVELRPRPSSNVEQHIRHVYELIKKFAELDRFDLSTKGDIYPLGGHIHVGGVEPTKDVLTLLDDFLGVHVINLSGNARGSYKRLSAYEKKPYGFEYRSCPAAIFHNRRILRISLKIVKNVLEKLINKGSITYNYPVQDEDYYRHAKLTAAEYKYFKWFIENYRSKLADQTLLYAWRVRKGNKPKPIYNLTISDNDTFSDQIRQALLAIPERFRLRKNIYIFGLHERRGNVYTFPTKLGGRTSAFDPCVFETKVSVGIAYQTRITTDEKIIKRLLRDLVRYLRKNKAIAYKRKRGV